MQAVFAEVLKDLGLFSKCNIGLISFTAYRNYYKEYEMHF